MRSWEFGNIGLSIMQDWVEFDLLVRRRSL
jgi:hypothetical protein